MTWNCVCLEGRTLLCECPAQVKLSVTRDLLIQATLVWPEMQCVNRAPCRPARWLACLGTVLMRVPSAPAVPSMLWVTEVLPGTVADHILDLLAPVFWDRVCRYINITTLRLWMGLQPPVSKPLFWRFMLAPVFEALCAERQPVIARM